MYPSATGTVCYHGNILMKVLHNYSNTEQVNCADITQYFLTVCLETRNLTEHMSGRVCRCRGCSEKVVVLVHTTADVVKADSF